MKRKRGLQKTLLILTVLAVLLMLFSYAVPKNSVVGNAIGVITTPVQRVFISVGNGVSGFFGYFGSMKQLREENAVLAAQVDRLEISTMELQTLQAENSRLTSLLSMADALNAKGYASVGARIASADSQLHFGEFTVNQGTDRGIKKLDAVVTDAGLVGYISEVGLTWARVTTIINSDSSVGALVARTSDKGLIEGRIDSTQDGLVNFNFLTTDASVVPGDYVETSGFGEIYPPGIMIGRVREVTADETLLTKTAVVEPAVDFSHLNEVLVILNQP